MIPNGLLSFDLAKKILATGKAVNFIRRCCGEGDWVLRRHMVIEEGSGMADVPDLARLLSESSGEDTEGALRRWVDAAYEVTNRELLKIMF